MPPGPVPLTDPPGFTPNPEAIRSEVDEIIGVAADTEGKLYAHLDDHFAEIQAAVDQSKAAILGQLAVRQDEIDQAVKKVVQKLAKQLQDKEDSILADAMSVGYTPFQSGAYGTYQTPSIGQSPGDLAGPDAGLSGDEGGGAGSPAKGPLAPTPLGDPPWIFPGNPPSTPQPPSAGVGGGENPGGLGGGGAACLDPGVLTHLASGPPPSLTLGQPVTPWPGTGSPPACFAWETTQVYVCNASGGADIRLIGHPAGGFLNVTAQGWLEWSPFWGGFGPAPGPPGGTFPQPQGVDCGPPGGPDPNQPPPDGGGDQCCVPPERLQISPTYAGRNVTNLLDGWTLEQPWSNTAPDIPSGLYRWCQLAPCPYTMGGLNGRKFVIPHGYGLYYNAIGLVWSRHGADAADLLPCLVGSGDHHQITLNQPPGEPPPPGPNPPDDGAHCPVPAREVCPPPPPAVPRLGQLEDDECAGFEDTIRRFADWADKPTGLIGMDTGEQPPAAPTVPSFWERVTGQRGNIVPNLVNRFEAWARKTVLSVSKSAPCDSKRLTPLATIGGILRFINQWTGLIPKAILTPLQQAENFVCQVEIPSGPQADAAYLSDTITKGVWECWHKAAGDMLRGADAVMMGQRTRPESMQLCMLYRRGVLDEDAWKKAMRTVGVITDEDRDRIYKLSAYVPGASDVVRFVARDVDDKTIVDRYSLDYQFEEKYAERLKPLGDANGIDKETMRLYWRAHWQRSSPGQLMDMMHRLRPDKVPEGVATTQDDIRQSMLQDDYTVWDVDRLIALSYRPLTRTDAIQGYMIRGFNEEETKSVLLDAGYSDGDSNLLMKYLDRRRTVQENKRSGIPTVRTMVNQYAAGVLGTDELEKLLREVGYTDETVPRVMESALIARSVARAVESKRWIKQRYVTGVISLDEAVNELGRGGLMNDDVNDLVSQWTRNREARGKIPSAAQLCKWRGQLIIGEAEQLAALIRTGWAREDALRIVGSCTDDLVQKEIARRERMAKKAQQEADRIEKERLKRIKQQANQFGLNPSDQPGTPAG